MMTVDNQNYVLCSHCDLVIGLTDVAIGHKATCPRCTTTLFKNQNNMKFRAAMYAFCSLIMLIVACGFVFIDINLVGNVNGVSVLDIPKILFFDRYSYISALFVLFVLVFPLLNLSIIVLPVSYTHLTLPTNREV